MCNGSMNIKSRSVRCYRASPRPIPVPNKPYGFCGCKASCLLNIKMFTYFLGLWYAGRVATAVQLKKD